MAGGNQDIKARASKDKKCTKKLLGFGAYRKARIWCTMYASQKWLPTGTKGLQHRSSSVFLFRKRVNKTLHRLYLGKLPIIDAELIASILDSSPPQKWNLLAKCTKNFCNWERSVTI